MSVEQQPSISSSSELRSNSSHKGSSDVAECGSIGEDASQTEVISESSVESMGMATQIRTWFESVPKDDIPSVIGFADEKFLSLLLDLLASTSPWSPSAASHVGEYGIPTYC